MFLISKDTNGVGKMFALKIMRDGAESGQYFVTIDSNGTAIPLLFSTGGEANVRAVELNRHYSAIESTQRVKVSKYETETESESTRHESELWRKRERERFESGFYNPVPWSGEYWFLESEFAKDHFPHISVDYPGKIAFTESHEKGVADLQLRMRAGKYLNRFFNDRLSHDEIVYWSSKVSLETGDSEFKIADTRESIRWVYENGPGSCMSYDIGDYSTEGIRPVEVYAAGDLGIAYMGNDDGVSSRTLVWMEKKIYARVYGDDGEFDQTLIRNLEDNGYSQNSGGFYNARLLRIPMGDAFVCPYLDVDSTVGDDGEYLRIGGGDMCAELLNGLCDELGSICEYCDSRYDDESEGGFIGDSAYCQSCFEALSFYCEDCDETHHVDNSVYIEGIGRDVCDYCAHNYSQCETCGDRKESDEIYTDSNGSDICDNCASDSHMTCEDCGELTPNNEMHSTESDHCESCGNEKSESEPESTMTPAMEETARDLARFELTK
jgi:hypothetical protein